MPVSIHIQITNCLDRIIKAQPQSVLDIGCGFGKWGYLCREYLDVFPGRPYPDQWTTRIDGIEFFEPYIMEHQRFLYDNIYIGDVRDLCKNIDAYDLIIAGDVIEHMFKDDAEEVMEALYRQAQKLFIVNIPLGEGWIHPEEYGNTAELHRSEWYVEDFQPYRAQCITYGGEEGGGLQYGSFFCAKGVPDSERIQGYLVAANFYGEKGDGENALRYARRAINLDPGNTDAICYLTDLQLGLEDVNGAMTTLEEGIAANPSFSKGHFFLAQLLDQLGRKDEARGRVEILLADQNADREVQEQARQWLARKN